MVLLRTVVLPSCMYVYLSLKILIMVRIYSICNDMLILPFLSTSAFITQFPLWVFVKRRGRKSWDGVSITQRQFSSALSLGACEKVQGSSTCPTSGDKFPPPKPLLGTDTGNSCFYCFSITHSYALWRISDGMMWEWDCWGSLVVSVRSGWLW